MRTDIVESVKKTCGAKKKATKTTTKKVVHSHNTKSGKKENQLLKSKKKGFFVTWAPDQLQLLVPFSRLNQAHWNYASQNTTNYTAFVVSLASK